jgi:hypothetical protein
MGIHQSHTVRPWHARLKARNHSKLSQSAQNIDVKTELEAELLTTDDDGGQEVQNQRHLFLNSDWASAPILEC